MKYRLLVVDDEPYICSIVTEALTAVEKYEIISFTDPKKALTYLEENRVDLVLTDLIMGDFSGVSVLDMALRCHPDCIVMLMTAYPTVNNAISVLKKGAYDYLVKPFKLDTLKTAVKRGLEHQALARENLHLKEQVALYKLSEAMGVSSSIQSILDLAIDTARSVVGAKAVSVLVCKYDNDIPVPLLTRGKIHEGVVDDFLKGDHPLCRAAMNQGDAQIETEELVGERRAIRSLTVHPLTSSGRQLGLLNVVYEDPYHPLNKGKQQLLSIIASKIASAIETSRLQEHLQTSYVKAIQALANAIEARDPYTWGHTDRVTILAKLIASRMNWPEEKQDIIKMGCTLHDIGKIGIPDAILNKPDRLTPEERKQIEAHPILGARILESIDYLSPAIPFVLYHHEKYDGSGYPHGLAGEDIPLEGRLLAVVDTFDAIVSDRPYRQGASQETAIEELKRYKGKQFDPIIVDVFVESWQEGLLEQLGIYQHQTDAKSVIAE
ncbi:MAG: response regulator [FCB group bacterium]|nr:response regulator [FCB group bacterium]